MVVRRLQPQLLHLIMRWQDKPMLWKIRVSLQMSSRIIPRYRWSIMLPATLAILIHPSSIFISLTCCSRYFLSYYFLGYSPPPSYVIHKREKQLVNRHCVIIHSWKESFLNFQRLPLPIYQDFSWIFQNFLLIFGFIQNFSQKALVTKLKKLRT